MRAEVQYSVYTSTVFRQGFQISDALQYIILDGLQFHAKKREVSFEKSDDAGAHGRFRHELTFGRRARLPPGQHVRRARTSVPWRHPGGHSRRRALPAEHRP